MPYFVFRIGADRQHSLIGAYDKYPEAKKVCRELREKESPGNPNAIRMAFGKTVYEAKRLLAEPRKPSSPLEEWEA
jgi:hypothetical protein